MEFKSYIIFLAISGWRIIQIAESGKVEEMEKRTLVVGAGVAGLCSARYLQEASENFTVLEATAHIGGTWRYEPRIGTDEHKRPIYTSMYKYLRTNLPKQTMEFPGFPMPAETPSFPNGTAYYQYLKAFTDHFDLKKHIKFLHEVTSIRRINNNWKVKYRSIISEEEFEENYDYIILGNGHHSKPTMPNIPGEKLFKGTIIHSHDYREPEPYANRKVLVVGAGPSGMDIGLLLADYVAKLLHSHHSKVTFKTPFPSNYIHKPDLVEFTENGALFNDGTFEEIDDVIYCTGFEHYYPFLDESSGLSLQHTSVTPLYRYMVNIRQPTMIVLGLVVRACIVAAIDAQARYSAALVSGRFTLPSEETMLREWQERADNIIAQGRPLSDIHLLAAYEDQFFANLSKEAGIARVPPVLVAIRISVVRGIIDNYYTFRNFEYTVLDDRHFAKQSKDGDIFPKARLESKRNQYYANLTTEAGIERVPPVLVAIRDVDTAAKAENLYTYRDFVYTVLSDREFKREYHPNSAASGGNNITAVKI